MSPRIIDEQTLQAREQEILETARQLVKDYGVAGLTMDKVVAKVPYSKGTVYNHFSCKEDLLAGICVDCMRMLLPMFRRIMLYQGNSRDRMIAVCFAYMLFAMRYPDRFMMVILAKTPGLKEKASPGRCADLETLDADLLGVALQIIQQGIEAGELELPAHMDPSQVAFSLWSSSFGALALLNEGVEVCAVREGLLAEVEVLNNANTMLNGYQWKPCSDFDWKATVAQLKEFVFASEVEELRKRGLTLAV